MPDGLYEQDILTWSEQQAALLRRLARGERVNAAMDWDNLIEEMEAVGRNELRACGSNLYQALIYLLNARYDPDSPFRIYWLKETDAFLDHARRA